MPKHTSVPAATFKARCLEFMDRVRETRETYIVTKHGKPVARSCRMRMCRPVRSSARWPVRSSSGRLRLVPSTDAWIRQSIELGRMQVAEITVAVAIEAGSIPPSALADPMDRLLVATARAWSIPIATHDAAIREYLSTQGGVRAIDVSR